MIQCKICGKELKTITPAHLRTHWTNVATYKALYPNAPLRDQETCQAISKAHKGKPKSPEHRAKLAKLNRERADDPEWIEKVTQAQRRRREKEQNDN